MTHAFWNDDADSLFAPPGNYRDYLDPLTRAAGVPAAKIGRTLDVGCNRAWACALFEDYFGVDTNELAIAAARQFWSAKKALEWARLTRPHLPEERFRVISPEAATLPFDQSTFGLIFAKDVLEHMQNPVAALQEFNRILRPGGWLFLCTPDAQDWVWDDPTHIRPYPLRAQRALAQFAGFKSVLEGYESIAPGTQLIAGSLGAGRSPAVLRFITRFWKAWPRNAWSVLQKT